VRPAPEVTELAPGEVRIGRGEVLVGTGTHAVRLGEVRPAGKKAMAAADWARGARLPESTVLGSEAGE
jgi:methionyl-tRNA formyltransferase